MPSTTFPVPSAELDGQVALVTGGGRGVGAFIARELAAAGARVAVSARTQEQVAGIARDIPDLRVDHQEGADLLVVSWGGTYGPVAAGVRRVRRRGGRVSHAHLRWLNPFPRNTGDVLRAYDRVLVPEMNLGQLLKLVRAEFLVDAQGYNRVRGTPFKASEIAAAVEALL